MRTGDLFWFAQRNLRQNPLRTVLCALSVTVGIGALTLITSLGLFGQQQIEDGLQTLGVSGLTVYLDERTGGNPLSAQTVDALQQAVPQVQSAMPIKAKAGSVHAGHASVNAVFLGVDEKLGDVMQLTLIDGTLFSVQQADFGTPVAVIGDDLAQALYGRDTIVGRTIRLRLDGQDQYFKVAGVVKAQTGALGGSLSSFAPHLVYVPYACLATQQDNADQVFVQCTADADPSTVGTQIERYLTDRKQLGGTVRVQNMTGMLDTVRRLAMLCTVLFLAVGAITLCVALLGVLSNMLTATHEKTAEIGVLLALGAQPRDIRRLFLLQSVLLCLIGGICGLVLSSTVLYFGVSMQPPDAALSMALLILTMLCGVLAGLVPAMRAARLDPVDAMRK